ncbi:MAG: endolytic transglycosylase MltG, partial [Chloroflexi bacterium]|nr:endolytic transglycosylase MltG [Chloroflexota bacterium]
AMSPNLTPRALADLRVSGSSRQSELTVFPGWRVEELASALEQHGVPIPAADFIAASHRRPANLALYLAIPAQNGLEGFLLPGRYLVERSANADLLVFEMASAFERAATDDLRRALEARGLSLYQAVTLASIIEREAMHNDEMPLIASVFLNRMNSGMLLEADPTVQYALGFYPPQATWWRSPLGSSDLQVDSPFNTYLYGGLPPGPICNPSLDALLAVANAPATSYYFFRAACDDSGRHVFAQTYNQHLANACP